MKRKHWIALAILIFFLIAILIWYKRSQNSLVDTEVIKRGAIVQSVYGIGTVTAVRSLSIKSGVTSTIRRLYVKEGQHVLRNSRLVDLEGIGEYKAPFEGVIVSAPFKEGETVYAQANVMTLVDPKDTYLLVSLEQQGALSLKVKLPVKISFDGLREQTFDGVVESIFSNGADLLAHISIAELPSFILPGMTADVAIILQEKKDVLLVPLTSVELKNAVLVRNGKTIRVPIQLGLVDGAYAEVVSGDVQLGDKAVIVKREIK